MIQDSDHINKILGSARSSQKSKQQIQHLGDELLASSYRDPISSYRIDSQRISQRVADSSNQIIGLIYDKKTLEKNQPHIKVEGISLPS